MSPDPSLFCAPWEVKNIHRTTYITNMIAKVALKGRIRFCLFDLILNVYNSLLSGRERFYK